MDVNKILEELRDEREQIEEAILSLERLAAGSKRRGRPPLWIQQAQRLEPESEPATETKKAVKRKRKAAPKRAAQV